MMEDTFEGLEDDDLDEKADTEVEKILFEVTNGQWAWSLMIDWLVGLTSEWLVGVVINY